MNYKIQGGIRRNRTKIIVSAILWLFIVIVLVVPFVYSSIEAKASGKFAIDTFFTQFPNNIMHPFSAFGGLISVEGGFGSFIKFLLGFTIFYLVAFFIGFSKSMPKNEYTDFEHGSSDWSQRGEQYSILSKSKGIILAENNYLPLDKRGNVNVLVVGRIRFW